MSITTTKLAEKLQVLITDQTMAELTHRYDLVKEPKVTNDLELINNLTVIAAHFQVNYQNIQLLDQQHQNEVLAVEHVTGLVWPVADAMLTSQSNIVLAVQSADCAPIIIYDPNRLQLATIHAGWRSLAANIVAITIQKILAAGSKPSDLVVILGPTIRAENYEVGSEVVQAMTALHNSYSEPPFATLNNQGNFQLDLPAIIADQVASFGVEKFTDLAINTYQNDNYFSYRAFTHGLRPVPGRILTCAMIQS